MFFTSWATAPSRPCLGTSPRRWQTLLGTSPTLLSTVFHINLRISAIITVLWEGYSIPHWKLSIGSCALEIYILHNQSLEQFSNDISDVKNNKAWQYVICPLKRFPLLSQSQTRIPYFPAFASGQCELSRHYVLPVLRFPAHVTFSHACHRLQVGISLSLCLWLQVLISLWHWRCYKREPK